ncbi:MAG: hypothetical protein WBM27_10195 [bacterium]
MGRPLKQRKLKKVRRVKIKSLKPSAPEKKSKSAMKTWEYVLFGAAVLVAIGFIIFAARTGSVVSDVESTPTPVEQSQSE